MGRSNSCAYHFTLPSAEALRGIGSGQFFPAVEDEGIDESCHRQDTSNNRASSAIGKDLDIASRMQRRILTMSRSAQTIAVSRLV